MPFVARAQLARARDRVLAGVVDVTLVGLPCLWLTLFLPWFGVALLLGSSFGYELVMLTRRRGQTFGKQLMRLRAVRAADGAPPTLRDAAGHAARKAACLTPVVGWTYGLTAYVLAMRTEAGLLGGRHRASRPWPTGLVVLAAA